MKKKTEEIVCPFCNNDHYFMIYTSRYWLENNWVGNKCDGCGLIYISPRPTKEFMKELYESGKNEGMTEHDHFNYYYSEYLFNKYLIRKIKKHTYRHINRNRMNLLELGVGGGMFYQQAEMSGIISFGTEINDIQRGRLRHDLGLSVYETMDKFDDGIFSVIFHKNVLSHLHDPITVFKKCYDKLHEDGIMLFVTGNGGNLSEKWLKILGRLGYPEHLFLYSIHSLNQLIEQTGFEVVEKHHVPKVWDIFKSVFFRQKSKKSDTSHKEHTNIQFSIKQKIRGLFTYVMNHIVGHLFPRSFPSNLIFVLRKAQK